MIAPGITVKDARGPTGKAALEAMKKLRGNATLHLIAGGKRGADVNATIAAVQASHGRNPWYIASDDKLILKLMLMRFAVAAETVKSKALNDIGRFVLRSLLSNVTAQRNKDGSTFARLTEKYIAYKKRKFGFTVPILKATGDLLGGVRVVINRTGQ